MPDAPPGDPQDDVNIIIVRERLLNYGEDRAVSSPPEWKMPGSGR
jgi:hypothetical protein